ncbi:iron-siderophore ABC transporter substrate-binding protein [Streptomyces sp. NPDC048057]|uniref:ABC transporter substrate-binding protein n=1 Tax=Streptomyces sp. NPDC048057 TaxID=3155628 RepID=UPI00340E2AA3
MSPLRTLGSPRRLLTAITLPVVAALVLTGCSGDEGTSGKGAGSDKAASGTHDVQHARGTAKVPHKPQRVVVLEPVQLDTAIALDVVPVGAALFNEKAGVPAYLGEKASGIASVGTVPEPNIEKIAALDPDLILGTESRHSALYQRLSSIAPTVFMATQTDPWTENVQLVARALGNEKGATALLGTYEKRCAEVAGTHQTKGKTAQLIRPRDGVLSLYGPTSFAGSTLECAGFTIPKQDWAKDISVDISPERVAQARADLVLVTAADVKAGDAVPESIRKNAKVFPKPHAVDQSFWIAGVGPRGGMAVLDDLDRILAASK